MPRRDIILVISMACLLLTGCARKNEQTKNNASESFIPAGYEVMKKAEGDLNGDGRDDVALALKHERDGEGETSLDAPPRLLVVLFAEPKDGFTQALSNGSIIFSADAGGAFGDPFKDLFIEDGNLVLEHYGGSSRRWGYTHYLRSQNNDWFVIKTIESTADLTDGSFSETISDYERGEKIETTTDAAGKIREKKSTLSEKPWPLDIISTLEASL